MLLKFLLHSTLLLFINRLSLHLPRSLYPSFLTGARHYHLVHYCLSLKLFEIITQYFARSWKNTPLAWLALPCSRSFAEVSPRLTQNIKSTPKISSMTGLFFNSLWFNVLAWSRHSSQSLGQTTLLFFFNGVTRHYPEDFPEASRMATQIWKDSCWREQ